MEKLAIACNESAGRIDAIRDYTFCLADAIRGHAVSADIWLRSADGSWYVADPRDGTGATRRSASYLRPTDYDALVLQYNPFMYGKWGFAPWLPVRLQKIKRARVRTRVALMVHEPYVPMVGWRWRLMGAWQRAQLEAARLSVDIVFASIEAWTRMLAAKRPVRPALHLPVGSNLPDRRDAREESRRRLMLGADDIVLASLSTSRSGRLLDYIVTSANAVAETSSNVVLLHLGAQAPRMEGLVESVRVHQPGRLSHDELASQLSGADVFLAPFVDGVSTRRGSMMAALQHAVPVVGTSGRLTDSVLTQATDALTLVPVDRPDLFGDAVVELAQSPDDADRRGRTGRALYESTFDWPVIAGRLLQAFELESVQPPSKVAPES